MCVTGVRWAESTRRATFQAGVVVHNPPQEMVDSPDFEQRKRNSVILTNDNAESRKMVEQCYQRGKAVINPIIDWTDADVWQFIRSEKVPYCCLYDEGFNRLGCIGCPMSRLHRLKEFARWPAYEKLYKRAAQAYLDRRADSGAIVPNAGETGRDLEAFWHWWLRDRPQNQIVMEHFL